MTAVAPAAVPLESVALVSIQSPSEMEGTRSEPIELTALSLVVSITALVTPATAVPLTEWGKMCATV